jgi:hypothetical protein
MKLFQQVLSHLGCIEKKDQQDILYIFIHVPKCAGSTINKHIDHTLNPDQVLTLYHPNVLADRERRYGPILPHLSMEEKMIAQPILEKTWIQDLIQALPADRRDSIRLLRGHLTYYGIHQFFNKEPRYFTFLRHPVDRVISHYNYHLSRIPERQKFFRVRSANDQIIPFLDWLEMNAAASNRMGWFLSERYSGKIMNDHQAVTTFADLERAKQFLNQCYFVGLTEKKSDVNYIYNRLKINQYFVDENVSKKYYKLSHDLAERVKIESKNNLDFTLYQYAKSLNQDTVKDMQDYSSAVFYTQVRRGISRFKSKLQLI